MADDPKALASHYEQQYQSGQLQGADLERYITLRPKLIAKGLLSPTATPGPTLEPGLVDVPLFLPGSEAATGVLQHPAVLPTAGAVVGGPAGVIGGEMLRQTLLPPSQQATPLPNMPNIPGVTRLAQSVGGAIRQPGILPAAASAGALALGPQAPGILNALGRTALGTTAATTAEVARKGMTGEPITPGGIAQDVALNAVVQGVPEVGTEVVRTLAKRSAGGRQLRGMAAAQEAEGAGQQVFAPVTKDTIDQQFALVRASGVQVAPSAIQNALRNLSESDQQTVLREIRRIGAGPNFPQGLGQRLADNFEAIMTPGAPRMGMDIGELQQLRSQIRIRAEQVRNPATVDLLHDVQEAIDQAIDSGRTVGRTAAGDTPQLLQQARANYARYRAADDLGALVTKYSRYQPGTSAQEGSQVFNLAGFKTELEQGSSRLAQSVRRSLDATPGAWDNVKTFMDTLGRYYEDIPIGDIGGGSLISMGRRVLSEAMLSPTGREMLSGFVTAGNGQVTGHQLAILGTMLQHQALVQQRAQPSGAAPALQ